MPTYVYRREDGTTFEIEQRITDDALEICPTTGQKVTRVISGGTGLIFKGSGFYLTDYARSSNGASADQKAPSKPPATQAESKDTGESKSSDGKSRSDSGDSKKS